MCGDYSGRIGARHLTVARGAFEAHVPRACDGQWLERVTGPARYGWDVPAVQDGFVALLYEAFEADDQLLVPSLAAVLLEAGGIALEDHLAELAAAQLQVLAVEILRDVGNARDAASAVGADARLPLSIVTTVSFTARQLAPALIAGQAAGLSAEARLWLTCRHGSALVNTGIGRAINTGAGLDLSMPGLWQLHLLTGPLVLATDVVIAARELFGSEEGVLLERWANRLGLCHRLAGDLAGRPLPGTPRLLMRDTRALEPSPLDLSLRNRALLVEMMQRQRAEAIEELHRLPRWLRQPLAAFAEDQVDPLISTALET